MNLFSIPVVFRLKTEKEKCLGFEHFLKNWSNDFAQDKTSKLGCVSVSCF